VFHNENLEGIKGVIRSHKSKDTTMAKRKRTKAQTVIYKTLQRKLEIVQQEPNKKPEVNPDAPEV
jgi:hypothetical protein